MPPAVGTNAFAFTGDRTAEESPNLVVVPQINMWWWKEVEVSVDEREFTACFGTEQGNKATLWKPTADMELKSVTFALRIPPAHVAWLRSNGGPAMSTSCSLPGS